MLVPLTTRTPAAGVLNTGRLASYLWTDFILSFIMAAMVIHSFTRKSKTPAHHRPSHRIAIVFLVLILIQYLSLFAGILRGDEVTFSYLGIGSTWIKALLILAIGKTMIRDQRDLPFVWHSFLIGYAGICFISLLELCGNEIITNFLNANYGTETHLEAARRLAEIGQYRVTATFDRNPHGLALYMVMGMTSIASVLTSVKGVKVAGRLGLMVLLGLGGMILMATNSMLGLAAAFASLGTLVVFRPGIRLRSKALLSIPVILIIVVFLVMNSPKMPSGRLENMYSAIASHDFSSSYLSSFTDRLDAWGAIISYMEKDPSNWIFGVGPSGLIEAVHTYSLYADNDYFLILLTAGGIGFVFFLLLLGLYFMVIRRKLRNCFDDSGCWQAVLTAARGTLCGFAVAGLAGPFIMSEAFARNSFFLWSLLGMASSFTFARKLR